MKNIILFLLLVVCLILPSCATKNPNGEREVDGLTFSEWGGVLGMAGKALLPGFVGSFIDRVNNDAKTVKQKKEEATLPPATPAASK